MLSSAAAAHTVCGSAERDDGLGPRIDAATSPTPTHGTDRGGQGVLLGESSIRRGVLDPKEMLVRRVDIAAVSGLVMLSAAGCGSAGNVGTDVPGRERPTASPANPQRGSACRTTPTTGDSTVMVDWVDVVQLHGVQYISGLDGTVPAVAPTQLGPVVGRVQCQLSVLTFQAQPGPPVDGDAAFLPIDTEVHAIRGYPPSCRVAAPVGGVNRVYLAHADVDGVSKPLAWAPAP